MNKKNDILVILAAGMSSRMKLKDDSIILSDVDLQQANQRTKSLITIGKEGQVLLDYVLFNAKKAGFKKVYLVTGEDYTLFKVHYENRNLGLALNFAIQYIPSNRQKPLGTADAVYQLLEQYSVLKKSSFIVCNSDNLYSVKAFRALRQVDVDQALIAYDREALQFTAKRISKFAVIALEKNYVIQIIEKPEINQLEKYRDDVGKIRVSMNLFKLSGALIYPFVKNCPLHPIRKEKELPVAINNYLKEKPLSIKAILMSEHVPDMTSKKDINVLRKQVKDIEKYSKK